METTPKSGDLRVWHIPQVPMRAFHVYVPDVATAELVVAALSDYDAFQFDNNVKPDYANVGGIEVFEDGEWCDYDPDWHDIAALRAVSGEVSNG